MPTTRSTPPTPARKDTAITEAFINGFFDASLSLFLFPFVSAVSKQLSSSVEASSCDALVYVDGGRGGKLRSPSTLVHQHNESERERERETETDGKAVGEALHSRCGSLFHMSRCLCVLCSLTGDFAEAQQQQTAPPSPPLSLSLCSSMRPSVVRFLCFPLSYAESSGCTLLTDARREVRKG